MPPLPPKKDDSTRSRPNPAAPPVKAAPPPVKAGDPSTRLRPKVVPVPTKPAVPAAKPAVPAAKPAAASAKAGDPSTRLRTNPALVKPAAAASPPRSGDGSTRLRRAPGPAAPAEDSPIRRGPPRKSKTPMLIGMGVAFVVIVAGIVTAVILHERNKPKVLPPPPPPVAGPTGPILPPKPPRHGDPDVNTALLKSDEALAKHDYAVALSACQAGVDAIEKSDRSDAQKQKLCRVLRDEIDTIQRQRDEAIEAESERARGLAADIDGFLGEWKLGEAERLMNENAAVLKTADMLTERKEKLDAMRRALAAIEPIDQRVSASGLSAGDSAALAEFLDHRYAEIQVKARAVVVKDIARPLIEEGRKLLDAQIANSKKRYDELMADKKPTEDAPQGEGDLFHQPRMETGLDPVMEKLPERLSGLRDKFTEAREGLKRLQVWSGGSRSQLRTLTDLAEELAPFPQVHYYLAVAAFVTEDYATASAAAEKAVTLEPRFGEAWALRARIAIDLDKFAEASQDLDKAAGLLPDHPEIYLYRSLLEWYNQKIDDSRKAVKLAQKLAPGNLQLIGTANLMNNVLDGPKWSRAPFEVKSDNYIVRSDVSQEKAQWLLDNLEGIRPHYAKICGGAQLKNPAQVTVFLFKQEKDYHTYGMFTTGDPAANTGGYYHPIYRQFLFFPQSTDEATLHVLYHEGFHQYAHLAIPNIPRWVNEALAEYAGGTTLENGKVKEEGVIDSLLRTWRLNHMTEDPSGDYFQDLLRNAYDQSPMPGYDYGWSLFHFLFKYKGGVYAPQARKYIDALRAGKRPREAFSEALPSREYGGIYSEWKAHLKKLKEKPAEEP